MVDLIAVSHRGYSARHPENTRVSYDQARTAGAPVIEADARLTADGRIMCNHDPDLRRLTGKPLVVAEETASTLADPALAPGWTPMFLDQVLALAEGRAEVLVDVKTDEEELTLAVLDLIVEAQAQKRVYLGLRSPLLVALVRAREPDIRCIGLTADCNEIPGFFDRGAFAVRAWEEDLDHPAVIQVLRDGRTVWATAGLRKAGEAPGTVTRERLERMRAAGIRAVLLNDPTLITGGDG